MNAKDQAKCLDAGLTIIRASSTLTWPNGPDSKPVHANICIKAKTKINHDWFTLDKGFKTIAARDRRMNDLQLDRLIIID